MPPFIAWISLDQPNKLIGYLLAVVMTIKSATHDVKIPPENQAPPRRGEADSVKSLCIYLILLMQHNSLSDYRAIEQ